MSKLSSQNRRDFIKLLSASAATPFIALPSKRAFAQTKAPLRLLTLVDTYGLPISDRSQSWISSTAGDYELQEQHLGAVLQPLSAYMDKMLVVSNMNMDSSSETSDSRTHHYLTAHTLTGSSPLTATRS